MAVSDEKITEKTGKNWAEWFFVLNNKGANTMTHKDIARWLCDVKKLEGMWAQTITVEYERKIGRRVVGQNCYGEFVAHASKSFSETSDMDTVLKIWLHHVSHLKEFNKEKVVGEQRISKSEKWRYWRISLEDGSKVNLNISKKPNGGVLLAIEHSKVADSEAREQWGAYWKYLLQCIG